MGGNQSLDAVLAGKGAAHVHFGRYHHARHYPCHYIALVEKGLLNIHIRLDEREMEAHVI